MRFFMYEDIPGKPLARGHLSAQDKGLYLSRSLYKGLPILNLPPTSLPNALSPSPARIVPFNGHATSTLELIIPECEERHTE
jgi:hypothetical protein